MMPKWNTKTLGDIAENVSRPFNFEGKDEVVFINTGDVLEGKFLHSNYSKVEGLPGQAKKAIKKGDILYSEIRPGNKRYAFVDFEAEDYVVSTKFMVIRPKSSEVSPSYLYMMLTSAACEQEFKIIADSRSGTFPQVTFDSLSYYPISYPDTDEQNKLFGIANSFLEKIELNRQINQTLEEMAQAIFKSWFVDFDSVKAKVTVLENGGTQAEAELAAMEVISGKTVQELEAMQAQHPEQYQQLQQTASLFPSAMQDSEHGEIPVGWEVSNIGDVTECLDRKRIPISKPIREKRQGKIPYYGATSIMDYVDDYIFDGTFVLVGEDGSVVKEDGTPFTQYIWGKSWVNNHAHVLRGKNGISTEQVLLFMQKTDVNAFVTGAVQLKINQRNLNSIPFLKASNEVNSKFSFLVCSMYLKLKSNTEENLKLAEIRNSLLPKLLAGELQISTGDVE